jgi:hypothetical protein
VLQGSGGKHLDAVWALEDVIKFAPAIEVVSSKKRMIWDE